MARHGPHPEAVARTNEEARAGRSERDLRLLADPGRAIERTKAAFAGGNEAGERFFRDGFELAYWAFNRRDWELNTLFCDRDDYVFRPAAGQLIDAKDEYRGIDAYIDALQLMLDVWAGVRIELLAVRVRPGQVVTEMVWSGRAARSGLAMEWNCVSDNRFRDGLATGQTFWWDRARAEQDLGFKLAEPARR